MARAAPGHAPRAGGITRAAMKKTFWRRMRRVFALLFAIFIGYQLWIAAHIWWWVDHNPESSAFMESRLSILQANNPRAKIEHYWLPYAQISSNLKRALVAAEDAKFVDHDGFDWDGIAAAAEKDLHRGRIVAGGSTISQQLAKNLFLSTRRTPWRKIEEAFITVMLEALMSKQRIFEIYLNSIEWGTNIFGAEAAARHYFQTGAGELNISQAVQLAAMVPNPRFYDRHRSAQSLDKRMAAIFENLPGAEIP
jgi:monofunctional biosynthetic peptidoglycan transglycosylase